jgi:hypothetical protein
MIKVIIIVIVALVVPLFFLLTWFVSTHNRLLTLRHRLKATFSQADAHLTHRRDLIPDLLEVAKPFMKDATDTVNALAVARMAAADAHAQVVKTPTKRSAMKRLSEAESALPKLLAEFFQLAETKADLKGKVMYTGLREDLTETQKAISISMESYNDAVRDYNAACERFPAVLIALPYGFKHAEPL